MKHTRSTSTHLPILQLVLLLALTSLFADGSQAGPQHNFSLPTAATEDAIFFAAVGRDTDETQLTSYITRYDLKNSQFAWKRKIPEIEEGTQISAIAISADTTKLAYAA